jgi:hypothetical protein
MQILLNKKMRFNKPLETPAPLLSRSSLCFAIFPLLRAARQSRGFHPAQRLASQRRVNSTIKINKSIEENLRQIRISL